MVDCKHVKPLWNAALKFCTDVLGLQIGVRGMTLEAVVFNVHKDQGKWETLPEASRAFLRHVVKYWYADMTSVITKKIITAPGRALCAAEGRPGHTPKGVKR